jgi:hypothetical protein
MPDTAGYSKRSRLDKLGVKPGMQVSVLGLDDPIFERELLSRTQNVSSQRPGRSTDIILFRVRKKGDLKPLSTLKKSMKRNGAIWILWEKGRLELKAGDVRESALESGLVDIKVAAFSEQLSGLKLVIPVAQR